MDWSLSRSDFRPLPKKNEEKCNPKGEKRKNNPKTKQTNDQYDDDSPPRRIIECTQMVMNTIKIKCDDY